MNNHIARFLLAHSPWPPFLSNLMLGFLSLAPDGQIYTTEVGVKFLDWYDLDHRASDCASAASGQAIAEDASA